MRKPIAAANWKMNGSNALLAEFAQQNWASSDAQVIFALPAIYLPLAQKLGLQTLAAQDVSAHQSGAHTGEISATMLKEMGCEYAIIGHSERRSDHDETEKLLIEKWRQLTALGIKPIYCIGESLEEYENKQTDAALARQLLPIIEADLLEADSVIAYEPVWAIGTGNTATPEYAQAVHKKVRHLFTKKYARIAPLIRILYGGSVKPDNAKYLYACEDIDGFLVGGASLKVDDFKGIIEAFS